jgi:hypothetical protein
MSAKSTRKTAAPAPAAPAPAADPSPPRRWPAFLAPLGAALLYLALAWLGVAPILEKHSSVFAFNDNNIELGLSPTYHLPEAFRRVWDNQFFFGRGTQQFPVIAYHALHMLMGPAGFRREGVMLIVWLAGLAGYWVCRQFGRTRTAALFGGLLLMLCGWSFTFCTVGLPTRTLTLIFAALAIGWIRRGRTQGPLCDAVAGGFLGLAVSETADVGMLFALVTATYFLLLHLGPRQNWTLPHALRTVARLGLVAAVSLVLAYQAIVIQFYANISGVSQGGEQSPADQYEWATQWSLPPVESWSLIAADYHGASSRSGEAPYWGGMGRSAGWEETQQGFRNYRLAGYALGTVALVLLALLYAFAARRSSPMAAAGLEPDDRREAWTLLALTLLCLALSWGKHFPLYRLFHALPYMGTIRNPDKWLGPMTVFAVLAVSMGADVLRGLAPARDRAAHRGLRRLTAAILSVPALIALVGTFMLSALPRAFLSRLQSEDFGPLAEAARAYALSANVVLLVVLVVAGGVVWLLLTPSRTPNRPLLAAGVAILVVAMAAELTRANRPYLIGHTYRHLSQPNPMTDWLNAHASNGRLKLIPAQNPLLNNWRMTYLTAGGYDLFDPVSISRMPTDYATFFDALGGDMRRTWQLGGVRYLLCLRQALGELQQLAPGQLAERVTFGVIQNSDGQYLPSADVPPEQHLLSIVEFTGALPLFRFTPAWTTAPDTADGNTNVLRALANRAHDPARLTWIQGAAAPASAAGAVGTVAVVSRSTADAVLDVDLPADGLLIHATKYDPDWKAWIDDAPAPMLRADYLFQAVPVPAGRHRVHLAYSPSTRPLQIAVAGRGAWLLLLIAATVLAGRRRTGRVSTPNPVTPP